mmetsp:Transcript_444/g.964  ORF Transcript_444/g.964 Transcript_444/m.964 type:complete len:128 (-) Transcript_444:583-966(-)
MTDSRKARREPPEHEVKPIQPRPTPNSTPEMIGTTTPIKAAEDKGLPKDDGSGSSAIGYETEDELDLEDILSDFQSFQDSLRRIDKLDSSSTCNLGSSFNLQRQILASSSRKTKEEEDEVVSKACAV